MEIKNHKLTPIPREIICGNDQDDIFISIEIGNGQIGGNKVTIKENLLAKGRLTEPTFIGKLIGLKEKEVDVETNVLDVNAFTNLCVITTSFKDQENKVLFTKIDKGEAPENGIASFKGKYVFKSLMLLIFVFSSIIYSVVGQNIADFTSLEMPASPGLILLDKTPSSIERPTTPQGAGLGLLGFFQGGGGAFEIAPFWLVDHPMLTAEQMYKNPFPILYNFSFSVASVDIDDAQYISGGFRTRLIQSYGKRIERLDSIRIELEEEALPDLDTVRIKKLHREYMGIIEKPIFSIDMAAALGGSSPENSFNTLEINRWAAWLSINWRPKGDDFYVTSVARYIYNSEFAEYPVNVDLIDIGARFNYDINAFTLSAEYLQRLNITDNINDDFRFAVVGSYRISENIFITSTFGKNFTDINNIIAIASINTGFSKTKMRAF